MEAAETVLGLNVAFVRRRGVQLLGGAAGLCCAFRYAEAACLAELRQLKQGVGIALLRSTQLGVQGRFCLFADVALDTIQDLVPRGAVIPVFNGVEVNLCTFVMSRSGRGLWRSLRHEQGVDTGKCGTGLPLFHHGMPALPERIDKAGLFDTRIHELERFRGPPAFDQLIVGLHEPGGSVLQSQHVVVSAEIDLVHQLSEEEETVLAILSDQDCRCSIAGPGICRLCALLAKFFGQQGHVLVATLEPREVLRLQPVM